MCDGIRDLADTAAMEFRAPIPEPAAAAPLRDGVLLACVFAALYLLLGQNSLHNYDLLMILRQVERGDTEHYQHLLYVPVAAVWRGALDLIGVSAYASYRALSSLAAALGVLGCHRAASVLGLGRSRSFWTAALCGSLPAVMNFATLAEIDAVLFGVASLCWWAWARMVRSGRWSLAAITGACSALAAATHAAGHLLAPALACSAVGWHWRSGARGGPTRGRTAGGLGGWVGRGLLLAATHGVVFLGLVALLGGAGLQRDMADNTLASASALPLDLWPRVLGQEWLLPYFPVSVLVLLGFRRPGWRGTTVAVLLSVAGYLTVTVAIFALLRETAWMTPQGALLERGAFLLGLTFPCALLGTVAIGARWRPLACATALGLGLATVHVNDWQRDLPEFAEGLHSFVEREPSEVLVEGVEELASVWKRYPEAPVLGVNTLEALLAGHPEAGYEHVKLWFDLRLQQLEEQERSLLISERALDWLRDHAREPLSRAAREYLRERFRMEPVQEGAFRAWRLER